MYVCLWVDALRLCSPVGGALRLCLPMGGCPQIVSAYGWMPSDCVCLRVDALRLCPPMGRCPQTVSAYGWCPQTVSYQIHLRHLQPFILIPSEISLCSACALTLPSDVVLIHA